LLTLACELPKRYLLAKPVARGQQAGR